MADTSRKRESSEEALPARPACSRKLELFPDAMPSIDKADATATNEDAVINEVRTARWSVSEVDTAEARAAPHAPDGGTQDEAERTEEAGEEEAAEAEKALEERPSLCFASWARAQERDLNPPVRDGAPMC